MIGSGAQIIGPVKVGDNARIAANAVVVKDVPENATMVGIPARAVSWKTRVVLDLTELMIKLKMNKNWDPT